MGKLRTESEKKEIIEQFKSSGLSKREFCKLKDISENLLYASIKAYSPELLVGKNQHSKHENGSKFIQLVSTSKEAQDSNIDDMFYLHTPAGIKVELPVGFSLTYLKNLIGVLVNDIK